MGPATQVRVTIPYSHPARVHISADNPISQVLIRTEFFFGGVGEFVVAVHEMGECNYEMGRTSLSASGCLILRYKQTGGLNFLV